MANRMAQERKDMDEEMAMQRERMERELERMTQERKEMENKMAKQREMISAYDEQVRKLKEEKFSLELELERVKP